MTLATVDARGAPDARMVLLKGHGPDGFRFFTNYESAKAAQLEGAGRAALVIYWRELDRQVRVRGAVERLPAAASDEYFATRPVRVAARRVGVAAERARSGRATSSTRSSTSSGQRHAEGAVPRPEHWGGYLLVPETIELWQGQVGRLHDRFLYSRTGARATPAPAGRSSGWRRRIARATSSGFAAGSSATS